MLFVRLVITFIFALVLLPGEVRAEQPIFDEMPRWKNGWGFQVLQEYRRESELLDGGNTVGSGLEEEIFVAHLQGVYTWEKWIRATAKIPYVISARRESLGDAGQTVAEESDGFGDATLAIPLKYYFNHDGRSGSWSFVPQALVPLGAAGSNEVYSHLWGGGLSLGYETETYDFHVGGGLGAWFFQAEKPAEVHADLSLGLNLRGLGSAGHLKWKTHVLVRSDETVTVSAGPTLYYRITDTVHSQIKWMHDFYDQPGVLDHGKGDSIRVGIGFVF